MSDTKIMNADSTKSRTPVAGWKRLHHKSRIILMLLGVIAIIVYLVQSGHAKEYAGVGAALCAIACGGFLVWHAVHLFAEQDAIDEQLAEKETNPTTSPPQSGITP